MFSFFTFAGMNNIPIPPEIKDDELYDRLIDTIRLFAHEIQTVLEVGASSGDGSTEAIASALSQYVPSKTFYTIEASPVRYEILKQRYANIDWLIPMLGSSVFLEEYVPKGYAEFYHKKHKRRFGQYDLSFLLDWYVNEKALIQDNNLPQGVIDSIKKENNIDFFDFVILDGSPYTGYSEFQKILGAKIIVFDDVLDIKHDKSHELLKAMTEYECIYCNLLHRNGYSIWVKKYLIDSLF